MGDEMEAREDRWLTPSEVAEIFQVNIRTLQRWANKGILESIRPNPTGHRKYRESQVRSLVNSKDN